MFNDGISSNIFVKKTSSDAWQHPKHASELTYLRKIIPSYKLVNTADIYKVNNTNTRKGVKYVQS